VSEVIKKKEKEMKIVKKKMEELIKCRSKNTGLNKVLELNRELSVCNKELDTLSKEIEKIKEGK